MTPTPKKKILILRNDLVINAGVQSLLLEEKDNLEVIGHEFHDQDELFQSITQIQPNVIVVDDEFMVTNLAALLMFLQNYPNIRTVIMTDASPLLMLVDDETPILESGKAFLEDLGYEIDASISPVDAFERFKMNPDKVHLIVSDLIMPEMTGEELARAIRKIRPDIPIIFWTGYSENINADALSEIGINEVLLKPITLSHLADTLRKVLGNRPPDLVAQPQ